MKRIVLMAAVCMPLVACETYEEKIARHDGICDSYGYQDGTTAHAHCMQSSIQEEAARAQAAAAAFQSAMAQQQMANAIRYQNHNVNVTGHMRHTYRYGY